MKQIKFEKSNFKLNFSSKTKQLSRSQPSLIASHQNFLFNSNTTNINNELGPLAAFTEEPIEIIKEATANIAESKELRIQSKTLIRDSWENIKQINKSVNEAFTKKIEETLALSVSYFKE